jgi:hypothetical protein
MTWRKIVSEHERRLLERIPHLPLVYEDNLLESGCHQRTADTIADYLGIPHVEVATDYARVTPRGLSAFVDNYEELVRFVEKTEFREYLSS